MPLGLSSFCRGSAFFFTIGTLLGFGVGGFGLFDAFLYFFLKGLLEELAPFVEEKSSSASFPKCSCLIFS